MFTQISSFNTHHIRPSALPMYTAIHSRRSAASSTRSRSVISWLESVDTAVEPLPPPLNPHQAQAYTPRHGGQRGRSKISEEEKKYKDTGAKRWQGPTTFSWSQWEFDGEQRSPPRTRCKHWNIKVESACPHPIHFNTSYLYFLKIASK